jgi:catechol 2,3-dioxygenase-like lactoylglutathione lyase family enzyme
MSDTVLAPDVVALRPFVPASDFETSFRFYTDLGFSVVRLDSLLAAVSLGPFGFLLQGFQAQGYAENFMMQLLVKDVDAWWARIAALDLAGRYGVREPAAPKLQPWGLIVAYVVDPSGVLWHIAQRPAK